MTTQRMRSAWHLQRLQLGLDFGGYGFAWRNVGVVPFADLHDALAHYTFHWTKEISPDERFYDEENGIVFLAEEANMLFSVRCLEKINWQKDGF